jgi:hypothetical protein
MIFGDYPETVKATRPVPAFTEAERRRLADNKPEFLGLNHYTSK